MCEEAPLIHARMICCHTVSLRPCAPVACCARQARGLSSAPAWHAQIEGGVQCVHSLIPAASTVQCITPFPSSCTLFLAQHPSPSPPPLPGTPTPLTGVRTALTRPLSSSWLSTCSRPPHHHQPEPHDLYASLHRQLHTLPSSSFFLPHQFSPLRPPSPIQPASSDSADHVLRISSTRSAFVYTFLFLYYCRRFKGGPFLDPLTRLSWRFLGVCSVFIFRTIILHTPFSLGTTREQDFRPFGFLG